MINNLLSFLTNENIYLIANWGVIPFWLLLIFLPYHQLTSFFTQSIIPFFLLGIGYAYLSYGIFLEGNILGGFELYNGLSGLYSMFANETLLLVFWLHFLAISLFAGAWMILPFSIIEMGALAGCMFYCNRQCNRQEVITVSDELVSIEQGVRQPNHAITYQRLWAKYLVSPPSHPWGVSRIAIRSHNHESELGQFLSQADKQQLVKALKRVTPR